MKMAKKKTTGKAPELVRARDRLAGSIGIRAALDGPRMRTIGGFLRAIREGEEQTLDQMAKVLDVSRQHLSNIELGRRAVGIVRAAAWADRLGYSPEQFVGLALQAEVDAAGLKLRVSVGGAA